MACAALRARCSDVPHPCILYVEIASWSSSPFTLLPMECGMAIASHKGAALAGAPCYGWAASDSGALHAVWVGDGVRAWSSTRLMTVPSGLIPMLAQRRTRGCKHSLLLLQHSSGLVWGSSAVTAGHSNAVCFLWWRAMLQLQWSARGTAPGCMVFVVGTRWHILPQVCARLWCLPQTSCGRCFSYHYLGWAACFTFLAAGCCAASAPGALASPVGKGCMSCCLAYQT